MLNEEYRRNRCPVWIQLGLMREQIIVDPDISLPGLKEVACRFVDQMFPEHHIYNLVDKILLFKHEPFDETVLQSITKSSDISENCLLEVVLSANATIEDLQIRPHMLSVHSYKSPHFCDFCGEMLFGLVKQGLKCEGCGMNFHKRCAYKIPNNCVGDRYRRRSSSNLTLASSPQTEAPPDNHVQNLLSVSSHTTSASPSQGCRSRSWCGRPIWLEREFASRIKVPHTFVVHNYKRPTVCQWCKRLLRGLFHQGFQCKDCKFNCHKRCSPHVPNNCAGEMRCDSLEDGDSILEADASANQDDSFIEDLAPETDDASAGNLDEELKLPVSLTENCNIPLMRVVQSIRRSSRARSDMIKEGWMVHFTNHDSVRRRLWWLLHSKCVTLFMEKHSAKYYKEIPLDSISSITTPLHNTRSDGYSPAPHVFEIHTSGDLVYYVGEDVNFNGQQSAMVVSAESGSGLEQARHWEMALRQALMPVTSSVVLENGQSGLDTVTNDQPDVSRMYKIFPDVVLGSGQFGIVYGGCHRETSQEVAIKVVDKMRFLTKHESQLKTEVHILQNLHHPGVVNLEQMFETPERIFVVMERMKGDMLVMILSSPNGRLNERVTKYVIYQIVIALRHLHSRNIVHCDLKPENVLLSSASSFPQVKLCDFGFARIIGEKSFRRSVVGTPAYLAPEVLKRKGYNRSLDMWSVGVITYVSLSGTFPFNEDEEINDQIHNASFMFPSDPWKDVSPAGIDIISNLLQVKLRKRFTVDKCIMHAFLQDYQTWADLRVLEMAVGVRYLTHDSDDERWESHRLEHGCKVWYELGQKAPDHDTCSYGQSTEHIGLTTSTTVATWVL